MLFVDDVAILKTLCAYFERRGHETLQASSGMEGIRLWREMQPDIAIVDMAMPGVDGLAALKELRGDGAMIIVLTAYGDIESAMTALKRGSGADPSPPASAVAEDVFLE